MRYTAAGRLRQTGHTQGIAIDIRVVVQHRDVNRNVFVGSSRIVHCHRRVVDRIDGDRHRNDIALNGAVAGLIGEGVSAVEVGVGRVGERSVCIQDQGAVGDILDQRRGQGIAVRVGVIAQHAGSSHGQRSVFVHAVNIINCGRRLVGRRYLVNRKLSLCTCHNIHDAIPVKHHPIPHGATLDNRPCGIHYEITVGVDQLQNTISGF